MAYEENGAFLASLKEQRVREEMLQNDLSRAAAVASSSINDQQSSPFQRVFDEELIRIARFVNGQQEGLELAAKALFARAEPLASGSIGSVQESYANLSDLRMSTKKTVDECFALQEFFTGSRNTLVEIAKKADEQLRGTVQCSAAVREQMPKTHLNSALVCVISDIYHALRQTEEKVLTKNTLGGDSMWEAPASFQRNTTKYWVKNENLTKLMLICATEAPLLVYGKKGPLTSTNRRDLSVSEGDKLWDTLATRITSIYFDSVFMSLYQERLSRAEGAQLLRARWYGPVMPTGDKIIFLELKTHHEKWVAQKSVKERACIQEKDMVHFLEAVRWNKKKAEEIILRGKPNMKADEIPKATGLLLRMHNLVVNHNLTACVRSVYGRAAFQSAKSNDLRLTLDRNVTLVDERFQRSNWGAGKWCLSDSEAQTARSTVVPFNVFEVKLAGADPMPAGLAQALNDSTMEEASKFSKFTTGAAAFNAVPTLPYWAAHPAFFTFFGHNTSGVASTYHDEYHILGTSDSVVSGVLPNGVTIAPKKPARVEPKTFFANERTFVQWISASLLLITMAGFLLQAENGAFNKTAAVISFFAFGLVLYSTSLYFKRLNLLKIRQPTGYFNIVNPIILSAIVGVVIFLLWADSIKGSDFLDFGLAGNGRRYLRQPMSHRVLSEAYEICPQEVTSTKLLIHEKPSALAVDSKRHAFLMTSGDTVHVQWTNDDGSVADSLLRINQSRLQGLSMVGDRLFGVSGGPERTELIEMAWWGTNKLRIVGRWTLEDSRSQIDGFSFVPSVDSKTTGSFYINMNSSITTYSVPAATEKEQESDQPDHPLRLKHLNMKVLTHGTTMGEVGAMVTFEGIAYILKSEGNVLEAWNLTDGTLISVIALPATAGDNPMMMWTYFALERRMDTLLLHIMMANDSTVDGNIWTFPTLEAFETQTGVFSFPRCQIGTTSMN